MLFDTQGWYTKALNYESQKWRSPCFGFPQGTHGTPGRRALVLHITDGTDSRGQLSSPNTRVSTHFLNREEGIYQHVSIHDGAWGNGIWEVGHLWKGVPDAENPNLYTISCESEGKPGVPISPKQHRQLIALLVDLGLFYPQFKVYTPHDNLIGHYEISPYHRPNCPGPHFDFGAIAKEANAAANGVSPTRPAATPAITPSPVDQVNSIEDLWVNTTYTVIATAGLKVRTGPGTTFDLVELLPLGTEIVVDVLKRQGESVDGDTRWLHLKNERGFVARKYTKRADGKNQD